MTKTYDYYHEDLDDADEEYRQRRQEEENQYYLEMMEQSDQIEKMDLDITESSEEELFRQILEDEREENSKKLG